MRTGLIIISIAAAFLAAVSPLIRVHAAITDEVEVKFVSGVVVGKFFGRGTATVTALVTNLGTRSLSGLRIEVYYSTVDAFPGGEAVWRPHEYVLEPPLAPGKSTTLTFTDDNAAEYILIELRGAVFKSGISYNGIVVTLKEPLFDSHGATYIAVRELIDIIGGEIGFDTATKEIHLSHIGREVYLRAGDSSVRFDGRTSALSSPVISIDGQTYMPLSQVAPLLGLEYSRDDALNMIMLRDAGGIAR